MSFNVIDEIKTTNNIVHTSFARSFRYKNGYIEFKKIVCQTTIQNNVNFNLSISQSFKVLNLGVHLS